MARPTKKRRLTPPGSKEELYSIQNSNKDVLEAEDRGWDVEQAYANRARRPKSKDDNRLPIRTSEGWQKQDRPEVEEEASESLLSSDVVEDEEAQGSGDDAYGEKAPNISRRQQIIEVKETLAKLADLINEDPEEHLGCFKKLAEVAASEDLVIRKFAIATQCAVYLDQIPGYRIRPHVEEGPKEKLSKDVRKLRAFEGTLLSGYQSYVKQLESLARGDANDPHSGSMQSVAINCASQLLLGAPHFNFRGDLIGILVARVSRMTIDDNYNNCIQTLERLFREDIDGRPSLDAVSALTKMIKGKNYRVREDVLNTFLHLRLLSEFTFKASRERVDREGEDRKVKGRARKQKWEHRSKKERKLIRERKVVEKEMKEADAAVGQEERDRMQAEMLKLVFATYFRILKAKTPRLMGAVLEGLAKYAHLINQDFFGDILEALKELIIAAETQRASDDETDGTWEETGELAARNVTRESLLCVITAFALLQGQDVSKSASALHLDLDFFITHLYQTIHSAAMNADIELSSKSLHLPDPQGEDSAYIRARAKVNVHTTTVLLIRSLSSVLIPAHALRAVPPMRIAAFTKQLFTISLQLPEKSCQAMLGLLQQVAKAHGRKIAALWNTDERRGDGVFNPLNGEVEASNPFATTIWEGELLRKHFSPKIRESMKAVEKAIAGT